MTEEAKRNLVRLIDHIDNITFVEDAITVGVLRGWARLAEAALEDLREIKAEKR